MTGWQRWRNVMKCYPFEEKRLAKWTSPYIVQPKYDGVRCRAVKVDSGYILLSSEENVIHSVPHINEMFDRLFNLYLEIDGELYCHGMKFEEIVSITSRTVNLHPDHQRIQFHCFDIVNEQIQWQRINQLGSLNHISPLLVVSPFYMCANLEDVMKSYDSIIGKGYEGIIVRNIGGFYDRKRSTMIMKFKPKQEDDYEIVDTQEEVDKDGYPKDTLGALICKSGDGHLFGVGTGFTDERRKEIWEGRDMIVGMNAKVKYQHITSGKQVPRFPVFVEITQL